MIEQLRQSLTTEAASFFQGSQNLTYNTASMAFVIYFSDMSLVKSKNDGSSCSIEAATLQLEKLLTSRPITPPT